jgi:hypothetical protein
MTNLDTFPTVSQALENKTQAVNTWIREVFAQPSLDHLPSDDKTIQMEISSDGVHSLIAINQDGDREVIATKRFEITLSPINLRS